MAEIDRILEQQERALLKLEESEVRAFLAVYNDSRRELRERLDEVSARLGADSWSAQHTRIALAEMEAGVSALQERLDLTLGKQVQRRFNFAQQNLTQTIGHFEPDFLGTSAGINTRALQRLNRTGDLLLHRYSTKRYSADLMGQIQAELARGHAARLPRTEVVRRIAGLDDSVFSGMEHRAALIDRMENARAYDSSFRAGLEEAAAELDEPDDPDPLLKKAIEFIDKRSHPFSAAIDGRVARVDGEWMVPVAEVRAEGVKMGKSISGVVWPSDGSFYRGATYPAHFNDRGRGIPWRASWGPFRGPIPPAPGQKPGPATAEAQKKPAPPVKTPKARKPPTPKPAPTKVATRTSWPAAATANPTPFNARSSGAADYWKPSTPSTGRAGAGTIFDASAPSPTPADVVRTPLAKGAKKVDPAIVAEVQAAADLIPTYVLEKMKERTHFELWAANRYTHSDSFLGQIGASRLNRLQKTTNGISDMQRAIVNASSTTFQNGVPRPLNAFRQVALHESGHALDGAYIQRTLSKAGEARMSRPEAATGFSKSDAWKTFFRKATKDGTIDGFAAECARDHGTTAAYAGSPHAAFVGAGNYYKSNPEEFFAEVCRMAWHDQSGRDFLEKTWPGILDSLDEMFVARLQ